MEERRTSRAQGVAGSLLAGVAKSDITTSEKDAVVNDPLYAKALVLDDGSKKAAIISVDTTAIGGRDISREILYDVSEDFLPALRSRVEKELEIPGCNILVNASHTHPPGRLLCNDEEQVKRTFDAIRRAANNMVPVKVGCGSAREESITVNRTLRLKSGKHWSIRTTNPCPPDEEVESVGPIDPEIGIIRVDRMDGKVLAVVYNFACHPLRGVPGRAITADFPGVASKVIEENLGNGAMALFLQGAAGDVIELVNKDVNRPPDPAPHGTILGLDVLTALEDIKTATAEINVASETVRLPRRTDIPERIRLLQEEQAELLNSLRVTSLNIKTFLPLYLKYIMSPNYPSDYSYRYLQSEKTGSDELLSLDSRNRADIEKYLANIRSMEKLARIQDNMGTLRKHQAINEESGEATIAAEVQGIRIGNCVVITSPAELLTEIGLNIKSASSYEHTFVAAFSNGYMHYGPPASYYDKGGYEVTECLLAPEWQKIYEKKAGEIIGKL